MEGRPGPRVIGAVVLTGSGMKEALSYSWLPPNIHHGVFYKEISSQWKWTKYIVFITLLFTEDI